MPHSIVESADGSRIAFESRGSGAPLILVGGAFNDRNSPAAGLPLAELLSDAFQVTVYDRRGRGDSVAAGPYAVEREIEDLRALAAVSQEPVTLFGHSSGAALALEAVADGLNARGLAMFEPPYVASPDADVRSAASSVELQAILDDGRNGDAAAYFLKSIGVPEAHVAGMSQAPMWAGMSRLAPTLAYENAIMRHNGSAYPPSARIKAIGVPILVLAGANSPDWMREVGKSLAAASKAGVYQELPGVDHAAPATVLVAPLRDFMAKLA